jgi:cell wall-associated NlpC family hydrolase
MRFPTPLLATALALALAAAPAGWAKTTAPTAPPPLAMPASGVVGVQDADLSPDTWVSRLQAPDRVLLDRAAIDARNIALFQVDGSMHDLRALPASLDRAQVAGWIGHMSRRPSRALYDEQGKPVPAADIDAMVANLDLDAIPASQPTRYGMVLERAALRSFPTTLRVFSSDDDADIDRFQESALFPGTPVAIVHASHDGKWLFVVSPRYRAWIEARDVAEGDAAAIFAHAGKSPYRVVTGAKLRTVFTRGQPQLSELQLDMGVRLPLADAPLDKPVNGQHPYASWIVELPIRNADGKLGFAPALLQRNTDTAADYLPLTGANIIRQAFKFLGERYGWGHGYNARDCSGFVSDVYASMGVQMARNTSDQSVSPAFQRTALGPGASPAARRAAIDALQVGDLVYIPGHVMMMIGRIDGRPYVIHDTNGGSLDDGHGGIRSLHLNGVSVTPLEPLRFDGHSSYIDRITNIVHPTLASAAPQPAAVPAGVHP